MKRAEKAYQWLSRSSLRLGVAASLLLHLAFGVWMVIQASRAPPPPQQRPGEVWIDTQPQPPEPPPEVKPDTSPRVKPQPAKTAIRKQPEPSPSPRGADTASAPAPAASDLPRADVPRAAPDLFPPNLQLSDKGTIAVEPSRGETIHPDDPRFDPDVIAAREKATVKGRVDGMAEDMLADARAQNGLPHPYLMSVRSEGMRGLDKLAREQGVRASGELAGKVLAQRYQSAVESYGKGGNPDLGPPGQAPRLSEKLGQPEQQAMRGLAQAT